MLSYLGFRSELLGISEIFEHSWNLGGTTFLDFKYLGMGNLKSSNAIPSEEPISIFESRYLAFVKFCHTEKICYCC